MTGYRVWYKHDRERDIDRIPNHSDADIQSKTLQQLREATQGLRITHMRIDGDIPPGLESITPDIQELKVKNLQDEDQLMR